MRCANREDIEFLFQLVNDEECRKNSLNSQIISIEEHRKWFENILHTDTQRIYILMNGNESIGQGRLELTGCKCRISYSITPRMRGSGYGKLLLKWLGCACMKEFSQCQMVYAEVLKNNVASQKIFKGLGYIVEDKGDYFYYYRERLSFTKDSMDVE